jgi:hypothetical protein
MKKILLVFLILTTTSHAAIMDQELIYLSPKLSKRSFLSVIAIMRGTFSPLAEAQGRKLMFYTDYNNDWAQAFARRWETDQILVYGGIAGIPGTTEDSFALTLCHELGHLYGGEPFSDSYNRLSVEGQADYWATYICFSQVADKLPHREASSEAKEVCAGNDICARSLDAALVMTSFFADNRGIPHPQIQTPDPTIVTEVLKIHPEPQCRLDTLWAGIGKSKRPACWMPINL